MVLRAARLWRGLGRRKRPFPSREAARRQVLAVSGERRHRTSEAIRKAARTVNAVAPNQLMRTILFIPTVNAGVGSSIEKP